MKSFSLFSILLMLCTNLLAQDLSTLKKGELSKKDSILYTNYKLQMARYINPNPDSSLYFIDELASFSRKKKYGIGLSEAEYLYASYFRRLQQYDSAIVRYKRALEIAKQIAYSRGIAVSNNGLCRTYYVMGKLTNAKEACSQCLIAAKKINDLAIISDTYIAFGNIYIRENELKESLRSFLMVDSMHLVTPVRGDIIAAAYQSLGTVYQELKDYKQSEKYFLKANEEFTKLPFDPTFYLNTTNWHLGEVYYYQGKLKQADSLLQKSLAFFEQINDKTTLAQINLYLGLVQLDFANLPLAEEYLLTGYSLHKNNDNPYETAIAALELGKLYLARNDADKSVYYLREALSQKSEKNNSLTQQESYITLGKALALRKDYSNAYSNILKGFSMKDSLNTEQSAAQIRELEAIYQTEQKEQQIALLKAENELSEEQNRNQLTLFILGGLVLLSGLITLYYLYRNKQKTNNKLKELDVLKSNFFANISHEFRTPLSLIMGPVEQQLSSGKLSDTDRQDLEMINRNSRRLLNLVDQLLDLSRLESGKYQIHVGHGDLGRLIRTQAEAFQFLATKNEIDFDIEVEDLDEAWFDRDVIEKVMANLLSNAMKYTNKEGHVSLRACRKGEKAVLSVENTALSLDPKSLEKLFDRFYQADSHTEGVGIGLSLVRELVHACHGSVQVKALDESTFQITTEFPIAQSAFKADEIGERSVEGTMAPVHMVTNDLGSDNSLEEVSETDERPIILVAEDNTDVRQLLKNNFSKEYNVVEASDGKQGIELGLELVPDLIISDIMMPEVDGLTLCKTLKSDERTSHIPIILLTARAGEEDQYKGLSTGADAYVTKPFKIKTLKTRVSHLIASRKALRDRYSQEVILKPKDIAITSLDEQFLERVQKVLENRLTESSFSIQEFSAAVAMSRMQLHRKLKALTGLSASEFIRSQRLKLAAELLKKSDANVSHIGYEVGFNDPSYFAKCFKEAYGVSPTAYGKKSS